MYTLLVQFVRFIALRSVVDWRRPRSNEVTKNSHHFILPDGIQA
jgi:hypothetical protein